MILNGGSPDAALVNPRARAVCVTGMHRSGTSFVVGALGHLGVSLGDPARMLRPGTDNPKGYFEIAAVQHVTETEAVKEIEAALAKGPRRGPKPAEELVEEEAA